MTARITLAKNIGFCHGVKRAQELVEKALKEKSAKIFMLGPLIHNKKVVSDLVKRGVKIIPSLRKIPRDSFLVISAHGLGPKLKKRISKNKIKVIDTTCPWLFQIQKLAKKLSSEGYGIILIGDKNHRETKGIKEWVGKKIIVISNFKEAKKLLKKKLKWRKVSIISQTTQEEEIFNNVTELFKKFFGQIKALNTICPESRERQKEIKSMAKKNNLMIVIGSKMSANSRRLFKISKRINKNTHFIAGTEDLEKSWFSPKIKRIGVISGASTPAEVITKIKQKIENFI